ncbi:MAG TPA: hypothetical protein VFW87_16260 [Pirellulales bacterium]|nr:hypothetical protein [Pirellulales bacterium]
MTALCFLALVCPVVAGVLLEFCPKPDEPQPYWSLGSIAGLLVCGLVALRTGKLRDLLFCPLVGMLAGYFDLQAMVWLYRSAGFTVFSASLAPVWGACIGAWVALGQPSRVRSVVVLATIILADVAARLVWRWLCASESTHSIIQDWEPLVAPLVYSPIAMLAVILARRAPLPEESALRIPHSALS